MKLSTFQRIVLVLGIAFLGLSFLPHVLSKFAAPDKVFMYLMLLEISAFIMACTAIGCFLFYTVLPDPDFKLTCKKWFTVTSLLFALSRDWGTGTQHFIDRRRHIGNLLCDIAPHWSYFWQRQTQHAFPIAYATQFA